MTTSEMLLEPFEIEVAMTRRILASVPERSTDWKPHEKSMTLGRLATHVATLPALGTLILTLPSLDVATAKFPDQTFVSTSKLVADFDAHAAETRAALASSSEADLQNLWRFSAGDFVFSNTTRFCSFTHTFLGHLIHHSAQLGVYLRLLDVPVPGVYGPSADDKLNRQP